MKTYLIDWGENCNGERYALIQSRNIQEAFFDADSIGSPHRIAELKIPIYSEEEGVRYLEIESPEKPYEGKTIGAIGWDWKKGSDVFAEICEEACSR